MNKDDAAKRRWSLLPFEALRQVVDVLEFGARKYAVEGWRTVPNARTRYYDATFRHLTEWWSGAETDPESGLHHLAHAACCVLFLLAQDRRES